MCGIYHSGHCEGVYLLTSVCLYVQEPKRLHRKAPVIGLRTRCAQDYLAPFISPMQSTGEEAAVL